MILKNILSLKNQALVMICLFFTCSVITSAQNQKQTVIESDQYFGERELCSTTYTTLNEHTVLQHYRMNPASWHSLPVDTTDNVGYGIAIAVDSLNRPHMSYSSFDDGTIKYARQLKDDSWDSQTVDHIGDRVMTALTVDQRNQPHLLYYDWITRCLKYATVRNHQWRIEIVDPAVGNVDDLNCPAITADSLGRIHIAYYDQVTNTMMYARRSTALSVNSASRWHFETIDSNLNLYFWPLPSIATDPVTNQVCVAYYGHGRLIHAVQLGVNHWETEIVDSYPGVNPSLGIGPNGLSVISYIHGDDPFWDDFCLMCARQQHSGEWICEVVDPYPRSGTDSSLAVDTNNIPHLVYIEYSQRIVTYVYRSPSGWRNEFVTQIQEGIWGPGMVSLVLEHTTQQPRIAFRTRSGSDHVACYAWRT